MRHWILRRARDRRRPARRLSFCMKWRARASSSSAATDGALRALRQCLPPSRLADLPRPARAMRACCVCPYHAWAYNLDGSLRSARHMPADFDRRALRAEGDRLRGDRGPDLRFARRHAARSRPSRAGDCAPPTGPMAGRSAKVAHRQTYPIAANWKLAVENYLECYHCTPAHPEYSGCTRSNSRSTQIAGCNAAMEARTRALGHRDCRDRSRASARRAARPRSSPSAMRSMTASDRRAGRQAASRR